MKLASINNELKFHGLFEIPVQVSELEFLKMLIQLEKTK